LRLSSEIKVSAQAATVIRHGAIALCNKAPSQIAAPTAIAR